MVQSIKLKIVRSLILSFFFLNKRNAIISRLSSVQKNRDLSRASASEASKWRSQ